MDKYYTIYNRSGERAHTSCGPIGTQTMAVPVSTSEGFKFYFSLQGWWLNHIRLNEDSDLFTLPQAENFDHIQGFFEEIELNPTP